MQGLSRVRVGFDAEHGAIAARFDAGRQYYAEVVTGALEGERFDVDEAATGSAGAGVLVLTLRPDRSARVRRSRAVRSRARAIVVRPHVTLGMLTGMFTPGLTGHDNPLRADGVWLFENDALAFYHLRADGVRWTRLGSNQDQSGADHLAGHQRGDRHQVARASRGCTKGACGRMRSGRI